MRKGVKVKMATDFNRPGFRYIADDLIQWHVFPDRIIIESEDQSADCGVMLGQILEKLPWTPLIAIGANIEFSGDLAELHRVPKECAPPECGAKDQYEIKQRSAHVALQRGDKVFNVQVSDSVTQAELAINIHTEIKDKARQEVTRLAQEACGQFLANLREAVDLAKKCFNVEIDYDASHHD